jgi:peptidoglycan-associated lipoprotein
MVQGLKAQKILKTVKTLLIPALALVLVTACAKPKKVDSEGAAAAEGSAPVIGDKAIGYDAQGSDSGQIAGLYTVNFEYDQARLTDAARKKLADNAAWMKSHAAVTVQIEGHTDERGSVEYNLSLGERRAKSVKSYLQGLGVDSKRMTILSYGEEKPAYQGHDEGAWSKNRRANFVPLQ